MARDIRPDDRARLEASREDYSDETLRRRFLAPKPRLSTRELRYLTEVDGVDHVALIALSEEHPDHIVAVARFVRLREALETAEFAIVIADEFQGRGLGTRLSGLLVERALALGIRRFTATALSDNKPAQRLLARIAQRLEFAGESTGVRSVVAGLAA